MIRNDIRNNTPIHFPSKQNHSPDFENKFEISPPIDKDLELNFKFKNVLTIRELYELIGKWLNEHPSEKDNLPVLVNGNFLFGHIQRRERHIKIH